MILKLTLLFFAISITSYSQPISFSWYNGDNPTQNYISPAKDQGEQGPCGIFAAVGAVEALSHIYYNKPFHHLNNGINLAEREIYSWCSGYGRFDAAASAREALLYADTTGIINESCFSYPNYTPFYTDCSSMCANPDLEVNIPGY